MATIDDSAGTVQRAPSVVQNLSIGADLYGDRSQIRYPYDTGVQLYTCTGAGGTLTPVRALNTHLLAGESEKRPQVGCDYVATFADSSFLPKGFATDELYFTVTSIGLSFVVFGLSSHVGGTGAEQTITAPEISQDLLALGASKGETNITGSGIIGAAFWRSLLSSISIEHSSDGRKCRFNFDFAMSIPSGMNLNDEASIGLSMPSNRLVLPVPFLLPPRNVNNSQDITRVLFNSFSTLNDPTSQAVAATGVGGNNKLYAVKYKLDYGGYQSFADGRPARQNHAEAVAAAAAEFRTVG